MSAAAIAVVFYKNTKDRARHKLKTHPLLIYTSDELRSSTHNGRSFFVFFLLVVRFILLSVVLYFFGSLSPYHAHDRGVVKQGA